MNTRNVYAALAALISFTVIPAAAQAISSDQAAFLQKAYEGGRAEIALGKLAEQKGSAAGTRAFGARMVRDHTMNLALLTKTAGDVDVALRDGLPSEARVEMEKLHGLSGEAFDREYLRFMVADHKADIADYKQELAVSHGLVRSYVEQSLPVIESHEKLAKNDYSQVALWP